MKKEKQINKNIVQGAVGGLLGACVGAPGVGVAIGLLHANKDEIKENLK